MGQRLRDEAIYTEPNMIEIRVVDGILLERDDSGDLRVTGWVHVAGMNNAPDERRIISRTVLTTRTARKVLNDLHRILGSGHTLSCLALVMFC